MAGKAVFPAKMLFMGQDKVRDTLMVDGLGRVSFLREKQSRGRSSAGREYQYCRTSRHACSESCA